MRDIQFTRQFKKDYKKIKTYKNFVITEFDDLIRKLQNDEVLDVKFSDHPLTNSGKQFKGARDVHLRPDIVILYLKQDNSLKLLRIGNHSNLKLTEDDKLE